MQWQNSMLSNYDRPPIEKVLPKKTSSPRYGNLIKSYDGMSFGDDALTKEISWKEDVFKSYDRKPPMYSPISNLGSESVPLEGLWSSQYSEPFKSKLSSSSN